MNKAKSILIGNHIWVGANVIIQKGAMIGDGCVIATYSIVNNKHLTTNPNNTPKIPQNAIIAGIPARVVKTGINWQQSFH